MHTEYRSVKCLLRKIRFFWKNAKWNSNARFKFVLREQFSCIESQQQARQKISMLKDQCNNLGHSFLNYFILCSKCLSFYYKWVSNFYMSASDFGTERKEINNKYFLLINDVSSIVFYHCYINMLLSHQFAFNKNHIFNVTFAYISIINVFLTT